MAAHHLAQLNIAKARAALDSELLQDFVNRLDEINTLADSSAGFVWRLEDEEGDATNIRLFDDPLMIVNLSVWEDLESLKDFAYRTAHAELIKARTQWFEKPTSAYQVLWWIPAGTQPSPEEAAQKLELIRSEGPTAQAFSFARPFTPQGEPGR